MLRLASTLALASVAVSQQAPGPILRTSTRLVQISVVVRDKNGPVADLTKRDFTLTDRGKPRILSVFSVERVASRPQPAPKLPPKTFTNLSGGAVGRGSVTVVLLDRLNTLSSPGAEPYEENPAFTEDESLANARRQLLEFVGEAAPNDRIAVYSLERSLRVVCDFTADRRALSEALKRYDPGSLSSRETNEPEAVETPVPGAFNPLVDRDRAALANIASRRRADITSSALGAIADHVARIPGRKNLVWLTADLPFTADYAAHMLSRANVAVYPVDARGLLPRMDSYIPAPAVTRIHGLTPAGVPIGERPGGTAAMQDLASETGGRAFINTNDLRGAVRRAIDDAAVTYTLGFYEEQGDLDGKFHTLKVRVDRGNVEVRYPSGYMAAPDPVLAAAYERSFAGAVQDPLESSAIHVLARVDRVEEPKPNSLRVVGSIDLRNLNVEETGGGLRGGVEVDVLQQDAAGRLLDRVRQRINLSLTKQQYAAYLKSGVFFEELAAPKKGLATLRVVVFDRTNAAFGSLIIPAAAIR